MNSTLQNIALQHLDGLFGYAMALTRNKTEAEDLVQETYLRATRAFGQFRADRNLKSWLSTILRNIFLDQVRHIRRSPSIVEIDLELINSSRVSPKAPGDPLASYLIKMKHSDVRNAIESLPPRYREVILLREFQDLTYQQIADILGCPTGTVTSRLCRAREKLKQVLQHWNSQGDTPLSSSC